MNVAAVPVFFDDVTRHYAKIFAELPVKTRTELEAFVCWIREHPVLKSLLGENALPLWWHESIFKEFQKSHTCQDLTLRTLRVLGDHKRLHVLQDILTVLNEAQCASTTVYWHTAQLFSQSDVLAFEKILSDAFGKPIVVVQKEQPDLLMGGVLLWNDSMIDLSLSSLFSNLYTEIDHVFTCS
ncbi:MAG: F0F1 ATP synthase subunit delta [Alphaproteobacteria bacterium]|nr:F0F1 ATP synthase subunit delta [Alphaproteobacteria bacterium]